MEKGKKMEIDGAFATALKPQGPCPWHVSAKAHYSHAKEFNRNQISTNKALTQIKVNWCCRQPQMPAYCNTLGDDNEKFIT
ncbi:MAG: hypothetical protein CTY37_00040 [Methylotenera sp.]|nr:MAG: hypothetical protein CTY37_00040 [Methylotenera sp.]